MGSQNERVQHLLINIRIEEKAKNKEKIDGINMRMKEGPHDMTTNLPIPVDKRNNPCKVRETTKKRPTRRRALVSCANDLFCLHDASRLPPTINRV